MRPLAIVVVIVGVVLLALGTWLILRASLAKPPAPAPKRADPAAGPREPLAFPPAAAVRTGSSRWTPEDDPTLWQRPSGSDSSSDSSSPDRPAVEQAAVEEGAGPVVADQPAEEGTATGATAHEPEPTEEGAHESAEPGVEEAAAGEATDEPEPEPAVEEAAATGATAYKPEPSVEATAQEPEPAEPTVDDTAATGATAHKPEPSVEATAQEPEPAEPTVDDTAA